MGEGGARKVIEDLLRFGARQVRGLNRNIIDSHGVDQALFLVEPIPLEDHGTEGGMPSVPWGYPVGENTTVQSETESLTGDKPVVRPS